MRVAYLDCFAGISGDMFLGALLDAGVPAQVMQDAVRALNLGASLRIETVDRSGISCTKVHVLEHGQLAEAAPGPEHQHANELHTHQPRTQHLHKGGHAHEPTHAHTHEAAGAEAAATGGEVHAHPHGHGRALSAIRQIIENTSLADGVRQRAIHAFQLLGYSEAKIHNVPVEEIHFHEVGAVDAIVDIVATCAGVEHLAIDAWYCSPVNVGGGMVQCAHGNFPVPAPATADLLRGLPTYSAHVQKELVTPTGAALLRSLEPTFGAQPAMRVEAIGYGAGTRNPEGFPNVLRLSAGEAAGAAATEARPSAASAAAAAAQPPDTPPAAHASAVAHPRHAEGETVSVLETALDDLSPQVLAYVAEKALAQGALDVMLTPVVMKKGRPGTLVTILCNPADSTRFEHLLLRETSTLGVRIRQDRRVCLDRSHARVETEFGSVRMKIGTRAGEEWNAAPEFEDCRALAERAGAPLKQVQQAAVAAYRKKV